MVQVCACGHTASAHGTKKMCLQPRCICVSVNPVLSVEWDATEFFFRGLDTLSAIEAAKEAGFSIQWIDKNPMYSIFC